MKKLEYVDSLRGFAILLVIINHTAQSIGGLPSWLYDLSYFGKYGVQLFFIMSAYTLCLSWTSRLEENRKTLKYYIRRYFRIAPLYYLGLLLYGLIVLLKDHFHLNTFLLHPNYSFVNVLANLTFTHSLSPETVHSGVPGGWSIGTEMVFYLIFPLLFKLFYSIASRRMILLMPVALMFLTFLFFRSLPHLFPPVSAGDFEFYYCSIVNQLPVFLIGMALFFYPADFKVSRTVALASLFLFITFFLGTFLITKKYFQDITVTTFMVGGSFAFLFIAVKNLHFLNTRLIQAIGRLSFSIYVFHFIFAWAVSSWLNMQLQPYIKGYQIYLIALLVTIIGAALISSLTKHVVEDRGIQWGRNIIKKMK